MDRRRGELRPAGDHRGGGADRHIRPRGQGQAVQDRGGQYLAVPSGQVGHASRVTDQPAHPPARLRPRRQPGDPDVALDRSPALRGGQVLAEHPEFAVGRPGQPAQQVHHGGPGRLPGDGDADRGAARVRDLEAETRRAEHPGPAMPDPDSCGEHGGHPRGAIAGPHVPPPSLPCRGHGAPPALPHPHCPHTGRPQQEI
ncbi:MAG: hypothetical protein ACRDNZ_22640 [Streptosporangiaceae bacterium]